MKRRFRLLPHLLFALTGLATAPVYANCNPPGKEADIVYNSDYHTYQFCNGTSWIKYQAGYSWGQQSTFNPTYPPGSGFFVLSHDTYSGNLGGRSGANSKCLTDLTTNTGWKGYSTANSNGQLVAGKVFAFLCDATTCNNLTASTTYYFANAGDAGAGGASFTTDSSGNGPNDSAFWMAANYFSGLYDYWTSRGSTGCFGSNWSSIGGSPCAGGYSSCTGYTSTSGNGGAGSSGNSNYTRYNAGDRACTSTLRVICYVNP